MRFIRWPPEGQQWVVNLHAIVFTEEHEAPAYGPKRRSRENQRVEPVQQLFKIKEFSDNNQRHLPGSSSDEPEQ